MQLPLLSIDEEANIERLQQATSKVAYLVPGVKPEAKGYRAGP